MNFVIKPSTQYPLSESILKDYGCYRISSYLEIHNNGDVSICCFSWLPKICGNVLYDSPKEILENKIRVSLIEDMDNGKFTECNDHCPYLNHILTNNEPTGDVVLLKKLPFLKQFTPIVVNFSYDRSCNLQCPSCREDLILHRLGENSQLNHIHLGVKKLISYLIESGEKLILNITGSGDSFASPLYWNYLKELSNSPNENIRLKLSTNGTLMNLNRLQEIESLWDSIYQINISIDAASKETYELIRKNGSFDKVKENLATLNQLVSSGRFKNLKKFQTNFTVQKANYKEVKDFVQWQMSYNQITSIFFNIVVQWDHISNQRFQSDFSLSTGEIDQLKRMLEDSIFNNPKVTLGNLNSIKNYESN